MSRPQKWIEPGQGLGAHILGRHVPCDGQEELPLGPGQEDAERVISDHVDPED